jgi:hypothetical protein
VWVNILLVVWGVVCFVFFLGGLWLGCGLCVGFGLFLFVGRWLGFGLFGCLGIVFYILGGKE